MAGLIGILWFFVYWASLFLGSVGMVILADIVFKILQGNNLSEAWRLALQVGLNNDGNIDKDMEDVVTWIFIGSLVIAAITTWAAH